MNKAELLQSIKTTTPAISSVPDKTTDKVVAATLRALRATLSSTKDGKVAIPGFGIFKFRTLEKTVEGKTTAVPRITFKLSEPKKPRPDKGDAAKS